MGASSDLYDECRPGTPHSAAHYEPTGTEVLQGRFKVSYEHLLGEGSFARVYKALDMEASKQVAIKIYKLDSDNDVDASISNLKKCVDVISAVNSKCQSLNDAGTLDSPGRSNNSTPTNKNKAEEESGNRTESRTESGSRRRSFMAGLIEEDVQRILPGKASNVVMQMDLRRCFVQLVGFSKDRHGQPGLDIDSEKVFVITELGEESLADYLEQTAEAGKSLELDTLRSVHWSLVSIACALHAAGFVHLDIKPLNVMRFGEVWKLIDFDGAVRTRSRMPVRDMFVSEWYMPPEVAQKLLDHMAKSDKAEKANDKVEVSRLMDVWSVGLSALEGVFLQPVLKPFYEDWLETTGDTKKFMKWLSDYDETFLDGDMREFMDGIDKDMSNLLQGMLHKNPAERTCIAESLVHPWFEPIRTQMWSRMAPKEEINKTGESSDNSDAFRTPRNDSKRSSGARSLSKGAVSRLRASLRLSRGSSEGGSGAAPSSRRSSLFGGRSSSYIPESGKDSRACAVM